MDANTSLLGWHRDRALECCMSKVFMRSFTWKLQIGKRVYSDSLFWWHFTFSYSAVFLGSITFYFFNTFCFLLICLHSKFTFLLWRFSSLSSVSACGWGSNFLLSLSPWFSVSCQIKHYFSVAGNSLVKIGVSIVVSLLCVLVCVCTRW